MSAITEQPMKPRWQQLMEMREDILITRKMVERAGDIFLAAQAQGVVSADEIEAMDICAARLNRIEDRLLLLM